MEEGPRPDCTVADLHRHLLSEVATDKFPISRLKSDPSGRSSTTNPGGGAKLKQPGGFRRAFLRDEAEKRGVGLADMPISWLRDLKVDLRRLSRLGYFHNVFGMTFNEDSGQCQELQAGGTLGTVSTVLLLLKSFVGTGILFLPGAMSQGGWCFSGVLLFCVGLASAVCIRLLMECVDKTGSSSFAGIGRRAIGSAGDYAVQVSLVLSQFGTCIAYMIFIARLLSKLFGWSLAQVLLGQVIVLVPMNWIRKLEKLEFPTLVADALIIFGLGAAIMYFGEALHDGDRPEVPDFKPATCGLFIGTAVFTFEGIPYLLPIRASMQKPEQFARIFQPVFAFVLLFFLFFGLCGYLTYGDAVQPVVLENLPQNNALVTYVKVGYCGALVCSFPLVFLPAQRILELWTFGVTPKAVKKHQKNAFRTLVTCCCAAVALYGGAYFAEFLAYVGALCCAPLAVVYPPLFHVSLCATTWAQRIVDWTLVVAGVVVMAFVFYQTISGAGDG
mmetsp:Transcript_34295/g.82880  ORF Transcript_34295/g.82880 Transcript_34295/m.82880 type:complete len:500 (+) Transcript_34295:62-1561(+)